MASAARVPFGDITNTQKKSSDGYAAKAAMHARDALAKSKESFGLETSDTLFLKPAQAVPSGLVEAAKRLAHTAKSSVARYSPSPDKLSSLNLSLDKHVKPGLSSVTLNSSPVLTEASSRRTVSATEDRFTELLRTLAAKDDMIDEARRAEVSLRNQLNEKDDAIASKNKEIDDLRSLRATLEGEVQKIIEMNREKTKVSIQANDKCAKMAQQLAVSENLLEEARAETRTREAQARTLNDKVQSLQKRLQSVEKTKTNHAEIIRAKEGELDGVVNELEAATSKVQSMDEELSRVKTEKEQVEQQLQVAESKNDDFASLIEDMQMAIDQFEKETKTQQLELSELRNHLDDAKRQALNATQKLNQEGGEKDKQHTELMATMHDLQNDNRILADAVESFQVENGLFKSKIVDLESNLQVTRDELCSSVKKASVLSQQKESLEAVVAEMQSKMEEAKSAKEHTQQKCHRQLQKQKIKAHEVTTAASSQVEEEKRERQELMNKLKQKEESVRSLTEKLSAAQHRAIDEEKHKTRLVEDCKKKTTEIESLELNLARLNKRLAEEQTTLANARAEANKHRSEVNLLRETIESLEMARAESISGMSVEQQEKARMVDTVREMELALRTAKSQCDTYCMMKDTAVEAVAAKEDEVNQLQSNVRSLREENKGLKIALENAKGVMQVHEMEDKELRHIQQAEERAQHRCAELDKELSSAKDTICELRIQLDADEEVFKQMEKRIKSRDHALQTAETKSNELKTLLEEERARLKTKEAMCEKMVNDIHDKDDRILDLRGKIKLMSAQAEVTHDFENNGRTDEDIVGELRAKLKTSSEKITDLTHRVQTEEKHRLRLKEQARVFEEKLVEMTDKYSNVLAKYNAEQNSGIKLADELSRKGKRLEDLMKDMDIVSKKYAECRRDLHTLRTEHMESRRAAVEKDAEKKYHKKEKLDKVRYMEDHIEELEEQMERLQFENEELRQQIEALEEELAASKKPASAKKKTPRGVSPKTSQERLSSPAIAMDSVGGGSSRPSVNPRFNSLLESINSVERRASTPSGKSPIQKDNGPVSIGAEIIHRVRQRIEGRNAEKTDFLEHNRSTSTTTNPKPAKGATSYSGLYAARQHQK